MYIQSVHLLHVWMINWRPWINSSVEYAYIGCHNINIAINSIDYNSHLRFFFFKFFVVFLIVAASRWWRSALGASRQRCHRGLRRCRSQHRRSWIDGQIQGWRTDRRRTTGRSRKSPTILEQRKHRQCWRFVSFSAFMLFQIIQNINCCCFFF